jgi:hypothetical protein
MCINVRGTRAFVVIIILIISLQSSYMYESMDECYLVFQRA